MIRACPNGQDCPNEKDYSNDRDNSRTVILIQDLGSSIAAVGARTVICKLGDEVSTQAASADSKSMPEEEKALRTLRSSSAGRQHWQTEHDVDQGEKSQEHPDKI